MRKIKGAVIGLMVVTLAGCANNGGLVRDDNPSHRIDEKFSTSIADDGTKFFVYWLTLPRLHVAEPRIQQSKKRTADSFDSRRDASRSKLLTQRLALILAKTRYCKNDFFELERRMQFSEVMVRGECRDAASAEDRKKFNNTTSFGESSINDMTAFRNAQERRLNSL